ncbi:MAG TPA: dihydrofolate reductase family protein [Pseudonocardiaceae bacterium]|jgi:dihydrofolate reductase|nr:dihydrofolate reductase family protein [Pseudonocardiaceae bacterium]
MGKIVVSENASVDGVIQDPVGEEGFRFAGWFDRLAGKDREAWAKVEFEEALGASALLMGRRTCEWFVAGGWPSRGGGWADRLRSLPKYVVSTTLDTFDWANSTVLKGDVVDEVAKLKDTVNGDVVVYGSGVLAHTLMKHDLVDELRLTICPFVLGDGQRVFGDTGDVEPMRLVDSRPLGDNLVRLTYQGVGRAG